LEILKFPSLIAGVSASISTFVRSLPFPALFAAICFGFAGCAAPDAGVANRAEPLRIGFRAPSERATEDDAAAALPKGGPNDVARFLAGMSNRARDDFQKTSTWKNHTGEMDVRWNRAEGRLAPIRSFRRTQLGGFGRGHVFYPFGGPDFLYADAFFPNAGTYALVGLESIGNIPDLSGLTETQIATSLRGLQTSISSSLDYSYFLTKDMRLDLARTNLKGVLPVLYVYLARTGHRIHSVDKVHITSSGIIGAGHSGSAPGVRLSCSGCTVYYFKTNLSNSGSGRFQRYMANHRSGTTFIKSASYLMHNGNFSNIRSSIMKNSAVVLQDASGIPYRYYKSAGWNTVMFGNYQRTLDLFKSYYQADLRAAYTAASPKPLRFGVGYTFTPSETCLILAKPGGAVSASAELYEVRPAIAIE
jgi:hypothetical protein